MIDADPQIGAPAESIRRFAERRLEYVDGAEETRNDLIECYLESTTGDVVPGVEFRWHFDQVTPESVVFEPRPLSTSVFRGVRIR